MNDRQVNLAELRTRAEAALESSRQHLEAQAAQGGKHDIRHLVEELSIYQTELEIQNQELNTAQSEISLALEKYRILFDNLPLPGLIADEQGFIVEANHQACAFLGLRMNAALQHRSIHQLFSMDSRSKLYAVMRDRANAVAQTLCLLEVNGGDGQYVSCDVHIIHLREEGDYHGRTLLVLVDQSIEIALRESEHNFRSLADSSTALIWASDVDQRCTYFNQGWFAFTGLSQEQAHDEGWRRSIHEDDVARQRTTYDGNFAQRRAYSIDYRIRRKDGEYRWIRDNATPRYDSAGQFIGYIGHGLDISDRVNVEKQLRQLSKAVEQSPESIVITDRDAVIEYVNSAGCRSSGYAAEDLIGQNPSIFNSGLTPPEVYQGLWQTLQQGKAWAGEFSNRRRNGDIYFEYVKIAPIRDERGEITHYVAVKEDISEKKQVSEELERHRLHLEEMVAQRTAQLAEAKETAESATRAKSEFLANMSHEIRTPMNAVMMLTHLLRQTALDLNQRDKLEKIALSADHLLVVINDILDFSKIEAGKLTLEKHDFHLPEVATRTMSMMQGKAVDKGLEFELIIDPALPALVNGDPTRLGQALLNFLSNAVKFTERGRITLRVDLLAQAAERYTVRFGVTDSGIGLDDDTIHRLFHSFEQADNSTTRRA